MRLLLLLSAILAALSGTGSARAAELRQVQATAAVASPAALVRVPHSVPRFLGEAPHRWQAATSTVEPQSLTLRADFPIYRLRPRE